MDDITANLDLATPERRTVRNPTPAVGGTRGLRHERSMPIIRYQPPVKGIGLSHVASNANIVPSATAPARVPPRPPRTMPELREDWSQDSQGELCLQTAKELSRSRPLSTSSYKTSVSVQRSNWHIDLYASFYEFEESLRSRGKEVVLGFRPTSSMSSPVANRMSEVSGAGAGTPSSPLFSGKMFNTRPESDPFVSRSVRNSASTRSTINPHAARYDGSATGTDTSDLAFFLRSAPPPPQSGIPLPLKKNSLRDFVKKVTGGTKLRDRSNSDVKVPLPPSVAEKRTASGHKYIALCPEIGPPEAYDTMSPDVRVPSTASQSQRTSGSYHHQVRGGSAFEYTSPRLEDWVQRETARQQQEGFEESDTIKLPRSRSHSTKQSQLIDFDVNALASSANSSLKSPARGLANTKRYKSQEEHSSSTEPNSPLIPSPPFSRTRREVSLPIASHARLFEGDAPPSPASTYSQEPIDMSMLPLPPATSEKGRALNKEARRQLSSSDEAEMPNTNPTRLQRHLAQLMEQEGPLHFTEFERPRPLNVRKPSAAMPGTPDVDLGPATPAKEQSSSAHAADIMKLLSPTCSSEVPSPAAPRSTSGGSASPVRPVSDSPSKDPDDDDDDEPAAPGVVRSGSYSPRVTTRINELCEALLRRNEQVMRLNALNDALRGEVRRCRREVEEALAMQTRVGRDAEEELAVLREENRLLVEAVALLLAGRG
ncbi:hypothetical protein EJ05DRAFT_506136 [Pseudovirgaria hyperparasitica]|uniref:Uncharacterized protein n=1 Tax=Pseudovirgaria hyperparasitica TaxID=470096 RepID=A0A6A6WJH0_9PEZI|nr:uncharacterized protein EJ05DRAFT_506136 [Pseudovirgaria hyperparasitica]KAF2762404.1 hypothetical protein EJ05DRAFT_506136 [Pseudovirgaria hyperparasitica]